jgi:hypothetical protein
MNSVAKLMGKIRKIVSELWNADEPQGYCCGVPREPKDKTEYMPTGSSCCGIRA